MCNGDNNFLFVDLSKVKERELSLHVIISYHVTSLTAINCQTVTSEHSVHNCQPSVCNININENMRHVRYIFINYYILTLYCLKLFARDINVLKGNYYKFQYYCYMSTDGSMFLSTIWFVCVN